MAYDYVGQSVRRVNDQRLLRGQGQYIADIRRPGLAHVAFVRSPHAHARIIAVDTAPAARVSGVLGVYAADGIEFPALPLLFPYRTLDAVTQIPFGREVHHVGEPVAMVVAENRYQAEDGAAAVHVEYEPLPAVAEMKRARQDGAPRVHSDRSGNLAASIMQNVGDAAGAMQEAPIVVNCEIGMGRVSCAPIETRGLLAEWSVRSGDPELHVYAATQTPHMMQRIYAELLHLSERQIHVQAPDVGGAFGAKEPFYVEDFLVAWVSRQLGRPVVWIEDRLEHLLTSVHEREQFHQAQMGLTRDGRILAVIDRFLANTGAYVPWGVIVPVITSTLIPGPYKVPNYFCEGLVMYTNTTPLAPYRGAGRPQAAMVINRLLDRAADRLHVDAAAIRQRNFIQPEDFPYQTGLISREGTPMVLDSGDYPALLKTLMQAGGYAQWQEKKTRQSASDRPLGIGLAVGIENTGMGPHEGATVTVGSDGQVTIVTGAASQGQGHETTLAQVAAEVLAIDIDRVHLVEGDSQRIAYGTGTFASRTAVVAGSAVKMASEQLRDKMLTLAEHLLGTRREFLQLAGGTVRVVSDPTRSVSLAQLAEAASGPFPGSSYTLPVDPGLSVTMFFTPPGATYAAGAHLVVVEVDRDTGQVNIVAYTAVHDAGTLINPQIVTGQIQGGISGGIGTALLEEMRFDEAGQLLTGTFMDYLLPTALDVPDMTVLHRATPSPLNPLGAKGVGESGAIPSPSAIVAAVEDALKTEHAVLDAIPVRPSAVRQRIRMASEPQ
ncbi:MAG: xanthine dehydrogenase family protein molybdopterin-binding subunit [Thermaerobacter sp.]|nr:xanthine dehydrogenase family protein molybdopterin-binding subunit [Thermaerobacter sp.]